MKIVRLTGQPLIDAIEDLAQLRLTVFRDWPYLYDGDLAYERHYLQTYEASERAIVVGVYDGDWLVGAATGAPLADHAEDFAAALEGTGLDIQRTFYCGESVLLPRYRGRGLGHRFFDLREDHARGHGFDHICFCAVLRSPDHPLHPSAYRALDRFWERRGYTRLRGAVAQFSWKDIDQPSETEKHLQIWHRAL